MGFWKVLAGAALGVGAVAAAPFTGGGSVLAAASLGASLSGAGAVTAATGAAALGALAGGVASAADDEKVESARREGERVATARYQKELEKLVVKLREAEQMMKDDKSYFELIIALFAVGLATASADGVISQEELDDIDQFVNGISHSNLPPHVKDIITRLRNNPPNFNTAMRYVNKVEGVDPKLFEQVIEVVSRSDGVVKKEETAFLQAFREAIA